MMDHLYQTPPENKTWPNQRICLEDRLEDHLNRDQERSRIAIPNFGGSGARCFRNRYGRCCTLLLVFSLIMLLVKENSCFMQVR
ncbi:hypothetical protein KOW79_020139 [Hemibagrus wyckioides]|uniref:Uncharacterized protein n=1 Tax=Hemibagrus wyckioides TaxID=337641 RepID=A0A9D3N584_9TELE|nr:hypothetical protein KOW79_020139 [Hemibagrus wyckioides]